MSDDYTFNIPFSLLTKVSKVIKRGKRGGSPRYRVRNLSKVLVDDNRITITKNHLRRCS